MENMETTVILNKQLVNELNQRTKISAIIFLILGAIGLIATPFYMVYVAVDAVGISFLVLGALLIAFGVTLFVTIANTIKKLESTNSYIKTIFNEDHLLFEIYENEEKVADQKKYFKEFVNYRVSENYIFVFINKKQAYPLTKNEDVVAFLNSKNIKRK